MTSLSSEQYKQIQEFIIKTNKAIKEKGGTLFWSINTSDIMTIDILLNIANNKAGSYNQRTS